MLDELLRHVLAFEATIAQWESGNFSMDWAGLPHPREEIMTYARSNFAALRANQAELLAAVMTRTGYGTSKARASP